LSFRSNAEEPAFGLAVVLAVAPLLAFRTPLFVIPQPLRFAFRSLFVLHSAVPLFVIPQQRGGICFCSCRWPLLLQLPHCLSFRSAAEKSAFALAVVFAAAVVFRF
jgi:hypothetical protein